MRVHFLITALPPLALLPDPSLGVPGSWKASQSPAEPALGEKVFGAEASEPLSCHLHLMNEKGARMMETAP